MLESRNEWEFNLVLNTTRTMLTDDERSVSEQCTLGRGWSEVAAILGDKHDAVRNRLSRSLKRVVQELGLAEYNND